MYVCIYIYIYIYIHSTPGLAHAHREPAAAQPLGHRARDNMVGVNMVLA